MANRIRVRLAFWEWKHSDSKGTTPGIGIFQDHSLKGHLTASEARRMADQLHDMADQLDAKHHTRKDSRG